MAPFGILNDAGQDAASIIHDAFTDQNPNVVNADAKRMIIRKNRPNADATWMIIRKIGTGQNAMWLPDRPNADAPETDADDVSNDADANLDEDQFKFELD